MAQKKKTDKEQPFIKLTHSPILDNTSGIKIALGELLIELPPTLEVEKLIKIITAIRKQAL